MYHEEECITFNLSKFHRKLFPSRKPLRLFLTALKGSVSRLHIPIRDLVTAKHYQPILSSFSVKSCLDTRLFTGSQSKGFNNRKQKGGVRFPVRLLTRSFWPSIVKYQQEGICITINTLEIITAVFTEGWILVMGPSGAVIEQTLTVKNVLPGQRASLNNKGKAWNVPLRENVAGERNWTNGQIIYSIKNTCLH